MGWHRIKRLARRGIYSSNIEYWVSINEIQMDTEKEESRVSDRRLKRERNSYNAYGLYDTRILIDRNFNLLEGYTSILIARENDESVVPVYFINTGRKAFIDED